MNAHAATVNQKAKAITSIGVIVVFFCIVTFMAKGCYDNSELSTLRQQVSDKDHENVTLTLARDKAETEKQNAENALAPWKQLADSQFTNTPLTKRLDLLFETVSSLSNVLGTLDSEAPKLGLSINGLAMSNLMSVILNTNRNIKLT